MKRNNVVLSTFVVLLSSLLGRAQCPSASGQPPISNTCLGQGALGAEPAQGANTALGYGALGVDTGGLVNTAVGAQSLWSNGSGSFNTATGGSALASNSTASYNTADGYFALAYNQTGSENTADGAYALVNNTAEANTANGYGALYSNNAGEYNTASGTYALYHNTTGTGNVAIGMDALLNNSVGSSNVAIGVNAGTGTFPNLNNTTAIGYYAQVNESNAMVLGTTAAQNGVANILVGIDVSSPTNILTVLKGGGPAIADGWTTYSSRRWKTNIAPIQDALGMVEQLRGVSYNLKESGKHEIGLIAEEVGAVVPEVVSYEENGKDARGVDYSRLTALLIEAVKEQQKKITMQQHQIARLSTKVGVLAATLRTVEPVRSSPATLRSTSSKSHDLQ